MKTINTVVIVLSVMFFSVISANASSHYDSVFTKKLVQRGLEDAVFFTTEDLDVSGLEKTVKVVDIQIIESYRTDQAKLEKIYENLIWNRRSMDDDNVQIFRNFLDMMESQVIFGRESNDYKENILIVNFQANFITEDGSKHKIVCGVNLVKFEDEFLLNFPDGVASRYRGKGEGPQDFEEKIRILHDYITFLKDNE